MFLLGISMHVLAVFECGVASLTLKVTIISSDFSSTHGDGEGEEDDDDDDDDEDVDLEGEFDSEGSEVRQPVGESVKNSLTH